jgi:hypothetical protein
MPNIELLKERISDSGITMVALSRKAGIVRETLYNRLSGVGEFTASEIVGLSDALKLTKAEREVIFFDKGSIKLN